MATMRKNIITMFTVYSYSLTKYHHYFFFISGPLVYFTKVIEGHDWLKM